MIYLPRSVLFYRAPFLARSIAWATGKTNFFMGSSNVSTGTNPHTSRMQCLNRSFPRSPSSPFRFMTHSQQYLSTAGGFSKPITVITRGLPNSFSRCQREDLSGEVNVERARAEHAKYVEALSMNPSVGNVIHLSADEDYPDCVFVEDTVVLYSNQAVITRSAAETRVGEGDPIANALKQLGFSIHYMSSMPGATMDGGDVLIAGEDLFVGLSRRTNEGGLQFLSGALSAPALPSKDVLSSPRFAGIPVHGALHLKSLATWVGEEIGFIIADTEGGHEVAWHLHNHYTGHNIAVPAVVFVPDLAAANALRVGNVIYYAAHCASSRPIFQKLIDNAKGQLPHLSFVGLDTPEINKADGALTCGSIIVSLPK